METHSIESRSEDVLSVLAYSPGWILRWGLTAILVVILLLLITSSIIRYPEIIESRITLTSMSPPANLVARASGLLRLYVNEGDTVSTGSYLASIENAAEINDVVLLNSKLTLFASELAKKPDAAKFRCERTLVVGELQSDFSAFLQNYSDYTSFVRTSYYEKRIAAIERQIEVCQKLDKKLNEEQSLLERQSALSLKKYETDKILAEKGLMSVNELASSEGAYLAQLYGIRVAESNSLSNNIQIEEYRKATLDLNQQLAETRRSRDVAMQEALKKLLSQISSWEQKFVLKAPVDGRIAFFKYWNNSQYVNAGSEIMVVVPRVTPVIGRVYLVQYGAGKTKRGQRVRIELDEYPFQEFGSINGEIDQISPVSRDNQYLVTVSLPNGLRTTYGRVLQFRNEMQGKAAIVTEDLLLLERLFNQLKSLLKNAA